MKALISLIVIMFTFNSFASVDSIKLVLEQTDVEKLALSMGEKSFDLSSIEDTYAASGVRPRCPCESLKLTFTKVEYTNGAPKKSVQVYSVNTTGFGTSLKVVISKTK